MVLDTAIRKTINNKEYDFKLPIKYAFQCERELTTKNLLKMLAEPPCPVEDIYTVFKWSYLGGENKDNVDEIFLSAMQEWGYVELMTFTYEVLQKSGLINTKNQQAAKA